MDVGDECHRVALTALFDTLHQQLLIMFPWVLHVVAFFFASYIFGLLIRYKRLQETEVFRTQYKFCYCSMDITFFLVLIASDPFHNYLSLLCSFWHGIRS